jgi:hypothetical protein
VKKGPTKWPRRDDFTEALAEAPVNAGVANENLHDPPPARASPPAPSFSPYRREAPSLPGDSMTAPRLAVIAALALSLIACGGSRTTDTLLALDAGRAEAEAAKAPAGKAVQVTLPANTAAVVGTPVQLVAQVTDKSGKAVSGIVLTWSSADPTVASVSATGLVTPLKPGTSKVSATAASAGGATGASLVVVSAASTMPARSRYVGTNLAAIAYWTTQFPFADMMKNSGGWWSREDNGVSGAPFPAMTADGYPAALKAGQHALNTIAWDNTHYAPGRYVVFVGR